MLMLINELSMKISDECYIYCYVLFIVNIYKSKKKSGRLDSTLDRKQQKKKHFYSHYATFDLLITSTSRPKRNSLLNVIF